MDAILDVAAMLGSVLLHKTGETLHDAMDSPISNRPRYGSVEMICSGLGMALIILNVSFFSLRVATGSLLGFEYLKPRSAHTLQKGMTHLWSTSLLSDTEIQLLAHLQVKSFFALHSMSHYCALRQEPLLTMCADQRGSIATPTHLHLILDSSSAI